MFTYKTALSTLVKQETKMTYDTDNHQLICGEKKYTVKDGKFTLPIEDITSGGHKSLLLFMVRICY